MALYVLIEFGHANSGTVSVTSENADQGDQTGVAVADFLFQRCCCHSVLVEHVPTTAAGYSSGCYRHKLRRGICTYPRSGRQ
jgi:hypothetical protein